MLDVSGELHNPNFEAIKQLSEFGAEYWSARELAPSLGYVRWENFQVAIKRAKTACEQVGQSVTDHFRDSTKMVKLGSGSNRQLKDFLLSRFACYLIAQNGDPRKPEIASAQAYFAFSTRENELRLLESAQEQKQRLELHQEVTENTRSLTEAARDAGVLPRHFGQFHRAGFAGMYGGLDEKSVKEHKEVAPKEDLLDRMGKVELAANNFRITQTESRLRRAGIVGQSKAIDTHREVGQAVRRTIEGLGNSMPEELPAEPSIKALKQARRRRSNALPPSDKPNGQES